MELRDFGRILREDKDEIDRVSARYGFLADVFYGARLLDVFCGAFEYRF